MSAMRMLLLVFVIVALPALSAAQTAPHKGSVAGYVWTARNAPIADAAVILRDVASAHVVQRVKSNASGEFIFTAVAAGHYVVELVDAGAPPRPMAIGNPFTLGEGETVATFVRVGSTQPVVIPDQRAVMVAAAIAWSNDMTYTNDTMRGGSLEVGLPIGVGQWVVFEAGYLRSRYPNVGGDASTVSRALLSVAGRLGSGNRHGIFGQVGTGVWMQRADVVGRGSAGRQELFSDDFVWTIGPGIGVDAPLGRRLSLSGLVEIQLMPQRPRQRWVHAKVTAGVTYRFR